MLRAPKIPSVRRDEQIPSAAPYTYGNLPCAPATENGQELSIKRTCGPSTDIKFLHGDNR